MEDPRRKRLLYRAMHRGFKEADIVIGTFAQQHLPGMTDDEVTEFERLLEVPDWDLYGWITGQKQAPPNYAGPLLDKMKAFPVAEVLEGKT